MCILVLCKHVTLLRTRSLWHVDGGGLHGHCHHSNLSTGHGHLATHSPILLLLHAYLVYLPACSVAPLAHEHRRGPFTCVCGLHTTFWPGYHVYAPWTYCTHSALPCPGRVTCHHTVATAYPSPCPHRRLCRFTVARICGSGSTAIPHAGYVASFTLRDFYGYPPPPA